MAKQDWLSTHVVITDLNDFEAAATSAANRAKSDSDPAVTETLRRLLRAGKYMAGLIQGADPDLTARGAPDEIVNQVRQATNELNQYVGNGNAGHVTNADNLIQTALRSPAQAFRLPPSKESAAYKSSLNALTSTIEEMESESLSRLTDLKRQADLEQSNLDAFKSESREQVQSQLTSVEESINEQKEALAALRLEMSAKFSEFEASSARSLQEFDDAAGTRLEASQQTFQSALTAEKKRANVIVTEIEEANEKATNLVGVIGRTGLTGGYQQDADAEFNAADRWRRYTIGFGIASVVVLVLAAIFRPPAGDEILVVPRVLLTAALGGLSTYCAAQAKNHRERGRRSRNLELALASIGPYLQDISDSDSKSKVLEVFAYLFFAPISETGGGVESPVIRDQVLEYLRKSSGSSEA